MEKHELYPNCDYRDIWGNLTYFANKMDMIFIYVKFILESKERRNYGMDLEYFQVYI